jgi:hypothetical protein
VYKHREKSLASELPSIAAEFHLSRNNSVTAEDVHPGSNTKFWWSCGTCRHEWFSPVSARAAGHGCPKCGQRRRGALRAAPKHGASFADLFPEVATEWHPTLNQELTPNRVRPASGKIVWWKCAQGHEWEARIADRRRYGRCRQCRRAR